MANFIVWCVWFLAAFACVASALGVVSFRNPFFSALALIGNLASLAVLYLLLGGEFVAAGQVLVYGGAVMVMFLFVIAYLGDKTDQAPWAGGPTWQWWATVLAAGAILVEVIVAVGLSTKGTLSHAPARPAQLRLTGLDRPGLPDRPAARVRGHLDRPARRRGRRRRARLARPHVRQADPDRRASETTGGGRPMNGPGITWYIILAAMLFVIGTLGVLIRRSPLIILLSVEIMLNGSNLALIAFARHFGSEQGQVFAIAVMAIAASEVVVGLGLIVAMGRRNVELDVDKLRTLRG